jgi:hypothetical protein
MSTRQKLQYSLMGLYFILFTALGLRILADLHWSWLAVLSIFPALYLADAVSGIAHFLLDYRYTTPGNGLRELYFYKGSKGEQAYVELRERVMKNVSALEEVVYDFKLHHISPETLGRRSFLRLTLPVVVFGCLPLSLLLWVFYSLNIFNSYILFFLWSFMAAMTFSQYAHSCAHKRPIPLLAKLLQSCGMFLTPRAHHSHHLSPDRDFCMLNGWANPLVNVVFNYCMQWQWLEQEGLEPR